MAEHQLIGISASSGDQEGARPVARDRPSSPGFSQEPEPFVHSGR
jgi:hypothetical protein